ncbi:MULTISPECIES: hypothetical protein [Vibrio]|uniref:Uncharacterized protein n=1 Tax=Vibrio bivalvicida TaxID=1276888 RepID=A0A177XXF7_9VIBR|nr:MULTISPECIES: hypothetical protein [Vibrio]KLN63789.1 hypothetical protein ZX61_16755 [Vibrio sp. VPAP30]OAJ93284.1 hypothetical protein APB76_15080 [Vibrio bivalvicida]
MNTIKDLTKDEFRDLLDDYFAPPEKRMKLTADEAKILAQKLNTEINVPLVSETKEEKILLKVVIKVDTFLYDNLPNEFYDLVRSLDQGIDDQEAERLVKRLTSLANDKIDIPYIPEVGEYFAIKFVIGVIVNSARKHWDFFKASEAMESDKILPA